MRKFDGPGPWPDREVSAIAWRVLDTIAAIVRAIAAWFARPIEQPARFSYGAVRDD